MRFSASVALPKQRQKARTKRRIRTKPTRDALSAKHECLGVRTRLRSRVRLSAVISPRPHQPGTFARCARCTHALIDGWQVRDSAKVAA